jgi:hypothetical protein
MVKQVQEMVSQTSDILSSGKEQVAAIQTEEKELVHGTVGFLGRYNEGLTRLMKSRKAFLEQKGEWRFAKESYDLSLKEDMVSEKERKRCLQE